MTHLKHVNRASRFLQNVALALTSAAVCLAALWPFYSRLREKILRHKALEAGDSIEKELENGSIRRNQYGDPRIPFLGPPDAAVERNGVRYHFNKHGFRGRDFPLGRKKKREIRVAFTGDSVMFGCGIPHNEETIPEIFRGMAIDFTGNSDITVLNFGISCYNTIAEHGVFDRYVLDPRLNIDIVVFQFLNNDFWFIHGQGKDDDVWSKERFIPGMDLPADKERLYLRYLAGALSRMACEAKKRGIEFFFMPVYPFRDFRTGVRDKLCVEASKIASALNIHLIDVFPGLLKACDMYGRWENMFVRENFDIKTDAMGYLTATILDDIHPNGRANAVISRSILRELREIAPYLPVKNGRRKIAAEIEALPSL